MQVRHEKIAIFKRLAFEMTDGVLSVANKFQPLSLLITPGVGLRLQRRTVSPKHNASVNLHMTGVVLSTKRYGGSM